MILTSHTIEGGLRISLRDKNGNSTIISDVEEMIDGNSNIEFLVTNSEGRVESKTSIPFRSFTPNFLKALSNHAWGFRSAYVKKISGSTTQDGYHLRFATDVHASSDSSIGKCGIVLGTSSVSKNILDYKLGGIVNHGIGSGQLFYGEMQGNSSFSKATLVSSPTPAAMYSISVNVSNLSSQSVSVKEVGLYGCGEYSVNNYIMLARDTTDYSGSVINILVNPGNTLNTRYNIYLNSSNGWTLQFANSLLREHVYSHDSGYSFSIRNIRGTTNSSLSYTYISYEGATEGIMYRGAVCGSSSVAQSPDNYKIYGLYKHGTGSDQLFYDAVQLLKAPTDFEVDPSEFIVYRDVFNYSSNPITISEVGWYSGGNGDAYTVMVNRKVLSEPVTLQPDSSLRVELLYRTRYIS